MRTLEQHIAHGIDQVFARAEEAGRQVLYEHEVYEVLNKVGIQTPKYLVVTGPKDLSAQTVDGFGPNLVVKIVSPDIAHKQKLGGVKILRGWDLEHLKTVMERMKAEVLAHFPEDQQPGVEGFLLVEFVPYTPSLGNETMIGCREDSEFGPIVLVSKGGDDAEFSLSTMIPPASSCPH